MYMNSGIMEVVTKLTFTVKRTNGWGHRQYWCTVVEAPPGTCTVPRSCTNVAQNGGVNNAAVLYCFVCPWILATRERERQREGARNRERERESENYRPTVDFKNTDFTQTRPASYAVGE